MGLHIHSLGQLPTTVELAYYVYLLDYGWHEPLGTSLYANFERMAELAALNEAVVMQGTRGSHFADEVLSWHSVNGQPADELLPAILITDRHPAFFREQIASSARPNSEPPYPLLLIPLRHCCHTSSDVAALVHRLFDDIRDKKALADFQIALEQARGVGGAITNALILQPNFAGVGVDLKQVFGFFKRSRNE